VYVIKEYLFALNITQGRGSKVFKTLIVDDERLDREGIKGQIEWKDLNITIVETAKNGFEALAVIESQKPDILITDVKMPGMNGLILAQKASEIVPWIKVIFISGFDDFEYVKNALLINAYEYLLKPVDTDDLLTAIKKVVNERIKERKTEEENELLINKVNESKPLLKQKLIYDIIYGTSNNESIWKNINYLNLNFQEGCYRILLCELDDYGFLLEELGTNKLENLQKVIIDIISKIEVYNCLLEFAQIDKTRIAVVLSFNSELENGRINDMSNNISKHIIEEVKNATSISITIGIGCIVKAFTELHLSYDESCMALSQKMLAGKGTVIYYYPKTNIKEAGIEFQNITNEMIQCIKSHDTNKANYLLDYLFNSLESGNVYGSKYIQNCCINIISRIEIELIELNESVENVFGKNIVLWEKLMKFETILDIRQWMKNIFRAVTEYFENKNSKKNRKIIMAVIQKIEQNYSSELTLKDVATEFFYSPNYLGAIFKEELGMGFSECLSEYRMKKAGELLQQTHLKMYEVASQVGYKNVPSFINQFKLSYSMTPTEYRERC
jgi:two-component system, response regulator YesN